MLWCNVLADSSYHSSTLQPYGIFKKLHEFTGVFRSQSNIYNGAFSEKLLMAFNNSKKAPL